MFLTTHLTSKTQVLVQTQTFSRSLSFTLLENGYVIEG